jgi:hypothetical protein
MVVSIRVLLCSVRFGAGTRGVQDFMYYDEHSVSPFSFSFLCCPALLSLVCSVCWPSCRFQSCFRVWVCSLILDYVQYKAYVMAVFVKLVC